MIVPYPMVLNVLPMINVMYVIIHALLKHAHIDVMIIWKISSKTWVMIISHGHNGDILLLYSINA